MRKTNHNHMATDYDKERARIQGEEDAKRDTGAGIVDIVTLGLSSNSSHNPPSDPELKANYDAGWEKAKDGR